MDTKILKYLPALVICLLISTALSCSSSGSGSDTTDIKFEVIKEGVISGFTDEKLMVIDNNTDYQKIMSIVYYNLDQMPIIPEVDFTKNTLILAAIGAKNTGGYSIGINNIKSNGSVTISITEISPGKNCVLTESVISPYQLVKVKKIKKEVSFSTSRIVKDCP